MKKISLIIIIISLFGGLVLHCFNGMPSTSTSATQPATQAMVPRLQSLKKIGIDPAVKLIEEKIKNINLNNYPQVLKKINTDIFKPLPFERQDDIKEAFGAKYGRKLEIWGETDSFNELLKSIATKNTKKIPRYIYIHDKEVPTLFVKIGGKLTTSKRKEFYRSTLGIDIYWIKKDNNFVLVKMGSEVLTDKGWMRLSIQTFTFIAPLRPNQPLPEGLYYWWSDYIDGLNSVIRSSPDGPQFNYLDSISRIEKEITKIDINTYPQVLTNINQLLAPFPEPQQKDIKKKVIALRKDKRPFNEMLKAIAIKNTNFRTVAGNQIAKSTLGIGIYWMKKDNNFVLLKMKPQIASEVYFTGYDSTFITPLRPNQPLPEGFYYWWSDYIQGLNGIRASPDGPQLLEEERKKRETEERKKREAALKKKEETISN